MSNPNSMTVLLVPRGESSEIISVLADYSAVELVDPFVWVDPADIGRTSIPATFVHGGRSMIEAPGQVARARRRTQRRRGVMRGEPNALACQGVDRWRIDQRIALAAQVAVAEIVSIDDDDVGTGCQRGQSRNHQQEGKNQLHAG